MDANTQQALEQLQPGSDAQFFTAALATQITKSGLTIAVILCAVVVIYYMLCMMGVFGHAKRSFFAVVAILAAGVGGFLLNERADAIRVIDDSKPVLVITAQKLEYDVRRSGWSIPWTHIAAVELKTTKSFVKNSVEQIDYEIQVKVKPGSAVDWKYEPTTQNDMSSVKRLLESQRILVIDPTPLGIQHKTLQKALEKYRAGL